MRVTNTVARVLAAGAGLLLASAGLTQSPGYPDRPVKIIVPFAAAGPTDVVARLITQKLSEKYGQQFYIENVAGAVGNLGMATAGRSPPDGYRASMPRLPMIRTGTSRPSPRPPARPTGCSFIPASPPNR